MRESFDHSPSGVAQQLSIGVQSNDKPNALELRRIADMEKSFKVWRGFTAEKPIELFELAAFAFPANPALLAIAPQAGAMEKKEVTRTVSAIQFLDAASDDIDVLRVLRHVLLRCVRKIRQKRKTQICISVTEIMDFKPVELALDRARSGEQHWHYDA